MSVSQFKQVGIVGAGQMGSGIAQVVATAGMQVVLYDVSADSLQKAKSGIEKSLQKLAEKGKLKESPSDILNRLQIISNFDGLKSVDLAIEAATEKISLKKEIFTKLDTLLKPEAVIGSNTSSISITDLASSTKRPDRFIGIHFMNPVPIMKLVEVIQGHQTSKETVAATRSLVTALEKTMIVSEDYPGFIVNRILMPMINEAITTLYQGIGTKEDIDTGMKLGTNHPMGPLELADYIGLDTCLAIMEVLYDGFKEPKYAPCPLLKKMVQSGALGKKSGRGFYNYEVK